MLVNTSHESPIYSSPYILTSIRAFGSWIGTLGLYSLNSPAYISPGNGTSWTSHDPCISLPSHHYIWLPIILLWGISILHLWPNRQDIGQDV
ncbi:hypothetical protein K445DRAFT_320810 [Daldinia sp. EC12]|nr:hypothetical protein K445DRAFT_320810 [Daldinia sp. EC12]